MNRIFIFCVILFLTICSIAGWDRYEISHHTIITLIGVDKQDDTFKLFLEYKTPHSKSNMLSPSGNENSNFLIGEGSSFVDAKNSYLRQVPDPDFTGSVRALILSDEFAKYGIEEYLNRIRGQREYRKVQNIFTTSTNLNNLFNSKELESSNIGVDIEHLSEGLNINGLDYNATISHTLEAISTKKIGFITNHLEIIKKKIINTGYSVFNNNKKIGFVKTENAKGITYFLVPKASSEFTVDFENTIASVEVHLKNKNIKTNYTNGNLNFDIKMLFNSHLQYTSKSIKIDSEKMKELGKKVEDRIKQDLYSTIETSQKEFQCDYLELYKSFRDKYNSDFEKINWNETYTNAKFNFNVKVDIEPINLVNFET